jgi:gluconolactonase
VSPDEEFEWLGSGYGGTGKNGWRLGVAEGPVWFCELNCLFFSDNANSKRYKWTEEEGITLHRDGTNNANGLTRDMSGRLIACEHDSRRVTREELDGSITVVADGYRGDPLNRPNDVMVKSDGSIYFTDPISFGVDSVLDIAGVYRVAPDLGRINLLVRDFALPNGLCLSPDEKILYVNDTYREHIRAFNFEATWNTWRLNLGSDRVFCDMRGDRRPGDPDGMKVDIEGNVWCTGPGGDLGDGPGWSAPGHDFVPRGQAPRIKLLLRRRGPDDTVCYHAHRNGAYTDKNSRSVPLGIFSDTHRGVHGMGCDRDTTDGGM